MKIWLSSLFLPFLTGCALMSTTYVDPVEYDLSTREDPLPEVRFEVGTFRNLSGSDRRFLYREKSCRMIADDYNRWLLSPDLMLERQMYRILSPDGERASGRNGTFVRISGTIYRFDFDLSPRQAVLSVDYTVRIFTDRKLVGSENLAVTTREAIHDDTPDAAAEAMSRCVQHSINRVRAILAETKTGK